MAFQDYTWPAVSVTATNPSVGTNGATAPTSSTEVGGIGPDGNLHAISTDNSGNQNVNVVSSTLPTGAATAANQVTGNNSLASIDGKSSDIVSNTGDTATNTATIASNTTSIVTSSSDTASNTSFIVTSSQQAANNTAELALTPNTTTAGKLGPMVQGATTTAAPTYSTGTINPISLTTAGALRVDNSGSALPSGSATAANQVTGNNSLASIDTKTPALGQALAAASTPVVLTAAQITTLTPPTSVTVTQATGTNLHTVVDSSALPTGASTSANQTTVIANQTNGTQKSQISTPTALTVTQVAKTVTTTAQRLTVSGSAPSATRVVLVVTPDQASTAKFYIGASNVTVSGSTRGIQITGGQVFTANSDAGDYYIISDTAAQTVYVMEQQ